MLAAEATIESMLMKDTTCPTGLSIVIPVYRESEKVCADIDAAAHFLQQCGGGEILIVDDGSPDRTAEIAEMHAATIPVPTDVLRLGTHRGKGAAVRAGILQSRGRRVLFADSGLCVPLAQAAMGIRLIDDGRCKIAHGIRTHIQRPQSGYRRLCSRLFNQWLIGDVKQKLGLTDTQCGFKVYDGDTARRLYAQSAIDGFTFDIEIILLAVRNGISICEFPVSWSSDPDSRLHPLRQIAAILRELIVIRRRFSDVLKNQ